MSADGSPERTETNRLTPLDEEFVNIDMPQNKPFESSDDEDYAKVPYLIGNSLPEDHLIKEILGYFTRNTYKAGDIDTKVQFALDTCIEFLERDYTVTKVDNSNGAFTTYYPATIPFISGERTGSSSISENIISSQELHEVLSRSFRARCRTRFPVSVIMYKGKCVCRSSTLAGVAEVYLRLTGDMILSNDIQTYENAANGNEDETIASALDETGWKAINEVQIADMLLLKKLKVSTIVDLMVENRKYKWGIPVTSSEKVDKNNLYHANFKLLSLPFPGCEFFKEFHDRNYSAEGLYFDWNQPMCDAELSVPDYPALDYLNINWSEYKKWDLIQMTQNYMKYILKYLQDNNSGILIHCISGWDRTPLFISLLRMSLWADGVIHNSLNTHEMLFFTLAYDWMLFGHHLVDRLNKKEDILLFCFTFLKQLIDDEYSVNPRSHKERLSESSSDFGAKSPEKKTEGFLNFDESDLIYDNKEEVSPSKFVPFPRESNESIDLGAEGPSSLLLTSAPEVAGSPERTSPVSMDCDDVLQCESDSCQRTPPMEIPPRLSNKPGTDNPSGSWQIVSATGSVRDSHSDVETLSSQGSGADENSRRGRLTNIRRLFYRCYYHSLTDDTLANISGKDGLLRIIIRNLSDMAQNFNNIAQNLNDMAQNFNNE